MTVIGHVVPREWCAMMRRINIKSSFGTPNIMHRSILSTYKENNLGRNLHKLLRSILGKRLLNFYALLSNFHSFQYEKLLIILPLISFLYVIALILPHHFSLNFTILG